jgi:hexokinase
MKTLIQLPAAFPRKKILSLDIGGTLAKVAFYIPKDDANMQIPEYKEKITKQSIPSKQSSLSD